MKSDSNAKQIEFSEATVVLAGNPNSGKTTLFNKLTGLRYKVGNYPGVTVEKKSAQVTLDEQEINLVDLPGLYALSGFSEDERIATCNLCGLLEGQLKPDLILAVADASNLERNLFAITQFIDLGLPIVLALTMEDLAEKNGIKVHKELLERELGIPVVSIHAAKDKGIKELERLVVKSIKQYDFSTKKFMWCDNEDFKNKITLLADFLRKKSQHISHAAFESYAMTLVSGSIDAESLEIEDRVVTVREELLSSGIDPESYEVTKRYQCVNSIFKKTTHTLKKKSKYAEIVDDLLVHKIYGLCIFSVLMLGLFQSIFILAQLPMQGIEFLVGEVSSYASNVLPEGLLKSLVVDGMITGIGNVIIFVPQISILFFLLSLLDDSGYLVRAAFLMDRVMRPLGLQGRSFIPLLSSFACAIPGIMSTRTIASRGDRFATIMVAPLMSCSARLPVYTVLIAAFIDNESRVFGLSTQGLVLLAMYVLGIVAAAGVAFILKMTLLKGASSLFLMEMPSLRVPNFLTVFRSVYDRVLLFIKNAGTMILACSVVLWFLASFPRHPEMNSRQIVQNSYAAFLGKQIEPVIQPLGYTWEVGVGLIASFAAREVFVSTLATIYNLDSEEPSSSLIAVLKEKEARGEFSKASAMSLMVFYVFACQCMSTLAVCKRETNSWFWVGFMFTYMTALAYVSAYITFNIAKYFI